MPGTQIALFCWSGPITLDDRKRNIERIMQFCAENGTNQLIVDTRQLVRTMSVTDTYDLGVSVSKKMHGIRIAVVPNLGDRESQFAQNVAANRGANVRSCVSIEEAQRWLAGE